MESIDWTLRVLARAAAERLAGRDVRINWTPPRDARLSKGAAMRAGEVGVIDLDPELDSQELLDVFLHEVAHLRLHMATLPDESRGPVGAAYKAESQVERLAYSIREREAAELARRWSVEIARAHPRGRGPVEEAFLTVLRMTSGK